MSCPECGEAVPDSSRFCPACGADAGFPNVRMAERKDNVEKLEERLAMAAASSEAAGYTGALRELGDAVSSSMAVIARPLRIIQDLLEDDRRPYSTYHKELNAGTRIPEDNVFDRIRTQFENALFPNFYNEIRYAALTLDGRWLESFGDHAMILKEHMIERRATVFEENPYQFARRHKLQLTDVFPPGYRAVWSRRGDLAMTKLYPKLDSGADSGDYPSLLMSSKTADGIEDYIEVHIYGPINRSAIERIVGPVPRSREDRLIWRSLKKAAAKVDVDVEEF